MRIIVEPESWLGMRSTAGMQADGIEARRTPTGTEPRAGFWSRVAVMFRNYWG